MDDQNKLWNAVYNTYCDSYWYELMCEALVRRWLSFDDLSKILVAATASGSVISGWALWTEPAFRWVWVPIAGFSAIMAIVHTSLAVPRRVADHGEAKRRFTGLRIDLETLRYRMCVSPGVSPDDFTSEFTDLRNCFRDSVQLLKDDVLATGRLKNKVQDEVIRRLAAKKAILTKVVNESKAEDKMIQGLTDENLSKT